MMFVRKKLPQQSKATKVFNISKMKQVLGSDLCSQLLFIHAFTGCDTTSHILVCSPTSSKECHRGPWTKAMAVLFGGKSTDSLASLRYTFLARKSLPPNHLLPQNVCLQLSPQPNTTAKEFTSRSWCGLERKVT